MIVRGLRPSVVTSAPRNRSALVLFGTISLRWGFAQYKDIVEGLSGLPILDADRLELSLKLAGRERDFFSSLYNPVHSELRGLE